MKVTSERHFVNIAEVESPCIQSNAFPVALYILRKRLGMSVAYNRILIAHSLENEQHLLGV